MHSTSALARYQNDSVTLFPITLVFFKTCASWKLGMPTVQEMIHISDFACFQIMLFAYNNYIIVLLKHDLYFQNKQCLN